MVVGHQVDGFDDVDFAIVRPQGAFGPERWPDGATVWDVDKVYDPEGAPVIEILAGDPDLCDVEGQSVSNHSVKPEVGRSNSRSKSQLTEFRMPLTGTTEVLSTFIMALPASLMYASRVVAAV